MYLNRYDQLLQFLYIVFTCSDSIPTMIEEGVCIILREYIGTVYLQFEQTSRLCLSICFVVAI